MKRFSTEEAAREYFEKHRWPGLPALRQRGPGAHLQGKRQAPESNGHRRDLGSSGHISGIVKCIIAKTLPADSYGIR